MVVTMGEFGRILFLFSVSFLLIEGHEDLLSRGHHPVSYQELFSYIQKEHLAGKYSANSENLYELRSSLSGFLNIEKGLEKVLANSGYESKVISSLNRTKTTTTSSSFNDIYSSHSSVHRQLDSTSESTQDLDKNSSVRSTKVLPQDTTEDTFQDTTQDTSQIPTQPPTLQPAGVSQACLKDLVILTESISRGEQWALKVVDSFGKVQSGILDGNLVWLGSFDECRQVEVKVNTTGSAQLETETWKGQYCTAAVSAYQLSLTVGLCVSTTCSTSDIEILIDRGLLNLPVKASVKSVQCQPAYLDLSTSAVAVIIILSCIGLLLLVGTLYDVIISFGNKPQETIKQSKDTYTEIPNGHVGSPDHMTETANENTPLLTGSSEPPDDMENGVPPQYITKPGTKIPPVDGNLSVKNRNPGVLSRILLSFSLYTNLQKIFTVQRSANTIDCLHGVRFLSMTWVILGHSFFFALPFGENLAVMPAVLSRWTFLAVSNATVSVDTFFLISGLLSSYLLLKEMRQRGGPKHISWPLLYFHRFWRLTPPYMILLGVDAALWVYMGNGPQWPGSTWEQTCAHNWWTNLLYINNLVNVNTACFGWGWYLANDMQFFIIMPILVIALYKRWMVGVVLNLVLMTVSFLVTGLLSAANNYPPSTMFGQNVPLSQNNFFATVYTPSYTRIGPYLIGILLGYMLYKTNRKLIMNKWVVLVGWASATACCLAVLYGVYGEYHGNPMDTPTAAFYLSVNRTAWAVGVAWLILACSSGYGGIVNKLLSWSGLVPLSRLTFMAYLVHPLVICFYLYRLRQRIYYEDYSFVYIHLGHLVISYIVALVASLSFEAPMLGLEKILLKRGS